MKEKTLDELIQEFKDFRGDKSFHVFGGQTLSPGTPNERHFPRKIIKGPLKSSRCRICNEPLEQIKKDNPKRRLLHYCSVECRRDHEEIIKIRKKLGVESVIWPPQKPPIPKNLLTYTIKGENGIPHKYKARRKRKVKSLL